MRAKPVKQATHYVPKTDVVTGDSVSLGNPQLSCKVSFINGLRVPVTIVYRSGLRAKLNDNRSTRSGVLSVIQEEEYSPSVFLDTSDILNDCGLLPSVLAQQIDQELSRYHHRPLTSGPSRRLLLKHTLTLEDLHRHGGSVYVPVVDVVVSIKDLVGAPDHPFSMQSRREALSNDPVLSYTNGLHYQIRIVDRSGVFGSRYINLNGEVFAVPVVDAGDYQDGVYVVSTHPFSEELSFPYARADYFTFEEAGKRLSLYLTSVEAATLGDPQSAYKRELDARKREVALEEAELRRKKLKDDTEYETLKRSFEVERENAKAQQAAREERLKEREATLEMMEREAKIREAALKRETMVEKEIHERESMRRKAHLELLKYGPSVIVGVWAIYKAIQKIRDKK